MPPNAHVHKHTITLRYLTINLLIISVTCLGLMTLVLIHPVRLNTPDLFSCIVVPFCFHSLIWLLTPYMQNDATILALWQLHFIKVTSQQTHTTHFPSPPVPAPVCPGPWLLPPSIHVQSSPPPSSLVVMEPQAMSFTLTSSPIDGFEWPLTLLFIGNGI